MFKAYKKKAKFCTDLQKSITVFHKFSNFFVD